MKIGENVKFALNIARNTRTRIRDRIVNKLYKRAVVLICAKPKNQTNRTNEKTFPMVRLFVLEIVIKASDNEISGVSNDGSRFPKLPFNKKK